MKSTVHLAAPFAFSLLSACFFNNTRMVQSWANPNIGEPLSFNKILVLAMAPSETERRSAEDAIVAKVGPRGVPSYQTMTMEQMQNTQEAKSRVIDSGADGMILVRWVGSRNESEIYATPMYAPLWDRYSTSSAYWQPAQVVNWQILQLETSIYAVANEKLIWSGTTETVEPTSIPKLIDELGQVVTKELTKQGLMKPGSGTPSAGN